MHAPRVDGEALAPGEGLLWSRAAPGAPIGFKLHPPRPERHRHLRKYAAGELGPEISFYFRGRDGQLNLRAQNLQTFVQLAEGVDDATWIFHLERGDYSRWFHERIKDAELAAEVEEVERARDLSPAESRQRVKHAIERRYTAPA